MHHVDHKRFPTVIVCVLPMMLALVSFLIHQVAGLNELLQFGRAEILNHQYHRLFTGHFTHWTARHMGVDTLVFVTFCYLSIFIQFGKPYSVVRYVSFLVVCALCISVVVVVFFPHIQSYRGLSALDWGWYGVLMVQMWFGTHLFWKTGAILMGLVFILKMILQIVSGHSMFVPNMGPGIVNMPGAHMAGMLCGAGCAYVQRRWERR